MSDPSKREGLEAWSWLAIGVAVLVGALFVGLGMKPGAPLGPWLYLQGTIWLFLAASLVLVFGILWGLLHRPVLARRRFLPLALMGLSVSLTSLPFPYPSSHQAAWSSVRFQLPFDGGENGEERWRVRWGGERRVDNALVFSPTRRFGFDFIGEGGSAFGRAVLAPCAGRVVSAEGDLADQGPRPRTPLGNNLVLEVETGRYLVLANLRQGSLLVAPGAQVQPGDPLASVGDSAGSSPADAPQLMVHLQDDPVPGQGEGVPMRFHRYEVAGRTIEAGVPTGGMEGAVPTGEIVRSLGVR